MKSKKLFLPIIILLVSIFVMAVCSAVFSIAKKPTITEGEFEFSITYELDGEKVTINDVYKAYYVKNDGYADSKSRIYEGEIGDMGEGNTVYTLKQEGNTRIELWTHFYPDYLMGDSEYDYFDNEPFEPRIYYYDAEETEYSDEETLSKQGVKLIGFEYPTPIKNSLVFSHLSHLSGGIVPLILPVSLLALITMIIFVRKEKDLKYKAIDIITIILNFIVSFTLLPFVTILALLIDIEGGGPELYYQVTYFIPSVVVLCNAASIALRRKGYGIISLIACLIGPAVFALYLIICAVVELF